MTVLKEERQTEITVKKSRFIAIAKKCTSIQQVKDFVDETRKAHPDARHVVHAAVVGNQFSFSDDREPKNTAGRPAFEVLKGSGISDICVLIVRYFGGTLLGTGGLVKAYGDSVKSVLDGIVTEERVSRTPFTIVCPYPDHDQLMRALRNYNIESLAESFADCVTVTGMIDAGQTESLSTELRNMTQNRVSAVFG